MTLICARCGQRNGLHFQDDSCPDSDGKRDPQGWKFEARVRPYKQAPKSYESTVMRMAGNIASGLARDISESAAWRGYPQRLARVSVEIARAIVAEVLRTEQQEEKK